MKTTFSLWYSKIHIYERRSFTKLHKILKSLNESIIIFLRSGNAVQNKRKSRFYSALICMSTVMPRV